MRNIILVLAFLFAPMAYAQMLTGTVVDEKKTALADVNVCICSPADSSFVRGTVTDAAGRFSIQPERKEFLLRFTMVGYQSKYLRCDGPQQVGVVAMLPDTKFLKDVTVTESYIVMKEDHMVIHVPENIKKNSFDGYATLSALTLPGLSVDPIAYTVTSKSGDVLLCINGREVEAEEVRTLNPQQMKRIDYYQSFDPKHPSASAVIDFILVNPNRGGVVYGNAKQHMNVGKGDGIVDLKHYNRNTELNFQISGDYGHYTLDRGDESSTSMLFNGGEVVKKSALMDSPLRANRLRGKVSWLKQGKSDMFQVAAYLSKGHDANDQRMSQTYSSVAGETLTSDRSHKDQTSPAAQLYYQRRAFGNGMLRATLYGNYSRTEKDRDYASTTSFTAYTKEDLYRLRPSVMLGLSLGKNRPYIYADYDYKRTKNEYTESGLESDNKLTYGNGMVQIGNNFIFSKKFRMTLRLTENVLTIDDGGSSRTNCFLSPSLLYTLNWGKGNTLNGEFYSYVNDPQMNYYNGSSQKMDQYQVLRGNPELKNGQCIGIEQVYDSKHKWGMFELLTQYIHMRKYIYEDVYLDDEQDWFVHTYKNGGNYNHFLLNGDVRFNLIPKKLVWMVSGEYNFFEEGGKKIHEFVCGSDLTYTGKNFVGKMEFVSPLRYLAKGVEYKQPNTLKLSLKYTLKRLQLGFDTTNPFIHSFVKTKYATDRYTSVNRAYSPRLSSNMFVFSLSYRISYGKKHNFQNIEMDNTQSSGLLEQQDIRKEEMEKAQK